MNAPTFPGALTLSPLPYGGGMLVTGPEATYLADIVKEWHATVTGGYIEHITVTKDEKYGTDSGWRNEEGQPEVMCSTTFGRPHHRNLGRRIAAIVDAMKALDEALGGIVPDGGGISVIIDTGNVEIVAPL